MFAPTTQDPKQFLEVKTLIFRGLSDVKTIPIDVYRATVKDIKNRFNPKGDFQPDRRSLFWEEEINEADVKRLFIQNP